MNAQQDLQKLADSIKPKRTGKPRILHHSDGAVYRLYPDGSYRKTQESERRANSTKVQRKLDKLADAATQ